MSTKPTTYPIEEKAVQASRFSLYIKLIKPRLSALVVVSAVFGFMMAPNVTGFDLGTLALLGLGGFLVTGSANTLNQILETESDKLMTRTQNRPMPTGRLSATEGLVFALILGLAGVLILGFCFNLVAALLAIISLISYAFIYTPLKKVSSLAVMVGAIPGAMPTLIGWAAATGALGTGGWVLFLIQFIWQFPHFWAIAWVLDDDYRKAGFIMLPSNGGRSAYSAFLILTYTVLLIPVSFLPWGTGMTGILASILLVVAGLGFSIRAVQLLRDLSNKSARKLMFFSLVYLPLVQIAMLIDKL